MKHSGFKPCGAHFVLTSPQCVLRACSWGNGSGSETCLVEQAQLNIDGRAHANIFWRPNDARVAPDAGLRNAASSFGGLITLGLSASI